MSDLESDLEKAQDIIDNYGAYNLDAWELNFLESVLERGKELSDKQKAVLYRIWYKGE